MRILRNKLQRGLTLIESAMVLAIATLVIAGIMVFYQNASMNNKTRETIEQIVFIENVVRTTYAGQPTFSGINSQTLIDTRAIPSKMVRNGVEITNPFKGSIDIEPSAGFGGPGVLGFMVHYRSIPSEACISILRHDHGRSWLYAFILSPGRLPLLFDGGDVPTVSRASMVCGNSVAEMTFHYK